MTYEVRLTAESEWRAAGDVMRAALLFHPASDEEWAKPAVQAAWREAMSVTAWDGERCVGHAGAFRFEMAVPGGGLVPMAGVTRIGVMTTHRRQGVLTAMMERLLREAVAEGRPVASLRASESVIYGRYGFQVAAEAYDVEIDRRDGTKVVAPVAPGSMRVLSRAETLATVIDVHARVGFDRPGAINRADWFHERTLETALGTEKATYVAVHTSPEGVDDGYVRYTLDWPEVFGEHTGGTCQVGDIWAASPAVELALWKYVLELDLVHQVRVFERPVDDPLRFAITNQRRYLTKSRTDEQWMRLLDVDVALRARTYNAGREAVTISVHDPLFPANDGVWRVSADGAERRSHATGEADLVTTINGISGAYLGGTSWHELVVAGVVSAASPAAVQAADVLFASHPAPRCGTFF